MYFCFKILGTNGLRAERYIMEVFRVRHCRFGSVWMIGWQKHEHKIELSCSLFKKNFSYCYFQKHEDESESWLHRQVRDENTASLLL